MFDPVYDGLVKAKTAIILDPPIYMYQRGNVVNYPEADLDQKCDMKINHLLYTLFGDETSYNIFQQKDGNIGGNEDFIEFSITTQVKGSAEEHKFTLLLLTSAIGEQVIFVIILE